MPQQSNFDAEALTELLVILDTIETVEKEAATVDCIGAGDEDSEADANIEREQPAMQMVVEEEVLVVVADDRSGHAVLIEMHRLIYHADDSPCSHFSSHAQAQQQQQIADMASEEAGPSWLTHSSVEPTHEVSYGMLQTQSIVLLVALVSAVLLLLATVTVACALMRRKHRQQRVLIQPPSIEQLGLDVPMLSSSPTVSHGQLVQL